MQTLEFIPNEITYEVYVHYRERDAGNWTEIDPGWKLHRKGLTREKAFNEESELKGIQQTVFDAVQILEVYTTRTLV